ncbi:MAG TPA: molybdate ABC transporter permease subunit [Pirellulales bacterium]|nr:molybdate ABC transporter permease subunit [Pirellulales bacterium]
MTGEDWAAIRLSVQVATCAVLAGLPLAVGLGYALARLPAAARGAVETLVNLPLVLPPVVTGYLLLVLLGRNGPIGSTLERWMGVRLVFTWQGAALASAVMAFPLMVRAARLAFQSVDGRLELAARGLGAGRLDAFFTVALPLAWRGVIAGGVLGFARSLGEFGATIVLAGNIAGETRTIPLAVYSQMHRREGMEQAWPLVAVSIVLAIASLAIGEFLERAQELR